MVATLRDQPVKKRAMMVHSRERGIESVRIAVMRGARKKR